MLNVRGQKPKHPPGKGSHAGASLNAPPQRASSPTGGSWPRDASRPAAAGRPRALIGSCWPKSRRRTSRTFSSGLKIQVVFCRARESCRLQWQTQARQPGLQRVYCCCWPPNARKFLIPPPSDFRHSTPTAASQLMNAHSVIDAAETQALKRPETNHNSLRLPADLGGAKNVLAFCLLSPLTLEVL